MFQDLQDIGQEGMESSRTDAAADIPGFGRCVSHSLGVDAATPTAASGPRRSTVAQQPDSILAVLVRRGQKLARDEALLGLAGSRIAQADRQEHLALA